MRFAAAVLSVAFVSPFALAVNSQVCATCHAAIARAYRETGMARSFSRITPALAINALYDHAASGIHYEMIKRGERYFQQQSTRGLDGKPSDPFETSIDYVLGSGNHARTYLHLTAQGSLIQLPLGWYAENGGMWAMNPGYDRPDHQGLQRKITYDCMFCHNAYPEIPPNPTPRSVPVYTNIPEGIDCQRCHGDGQKHLALAARQGASAEEIRRAIVNPSRLTSERQMEVCMQCHLETTSSPLPASIVRYERGPFSYRPGEPLADFILHFDHAPSAQDHAPPAQDHAPSTQAHASATGNVDRVEITGSVYRLRQSECFRKSKGAGNGEMTCATCHNPHQALGGEAAARHYTSVCRQCHGAALNRLITAGAHTRSTDCTGCHMPKRRTDDVVHAVMTDHLIQRSKPARDLLAPLAEHPVDANPYRGEVVPYYPPALPQPSDDLYLAIAQVSEQSNLIAGISRLQAAIETYPLANAEYFLQLGDALSNTGRFTEAFREYVKAQTLAPQSAPALERLALCLVSLGAYSSAESTFKQALDLTPNAAATWIQLGAVRLRQGRARDAVTAFEKAIELDPEMPEAFDTAGAAWFHIGDLTRAETALRTAIRLQPNYAPAHGNLGNLLSASDRFEEARTHFEAALRFNQNDKGARYDYAIALARVHRMDEAQTQVEAILRADPGSAQAHEFLGNLMGAKGQRERAIQQFREALRIQPDFARANLDLGAALADSGDLASALPYLRRAAQSIDPAVHDQARKLIEKLGKVP